jgi:hypothetical protein
MSHQKYGGGILLTILFVSIYVTFTTPVIAAVVPLTNETLTTAQHPAPAWFDGNQVDGFFGETVDGRIFTQRPITNEFGIRLHRFQIDEVYFYVSDRGVIYAPNNLVALSIYLTLV